MKKLISVICLISLLLCTIASCNTTGSTDTSGKPSSTSSPESDSNTVTGSEGSETEPNSPSNTEKSYVYLASPAIKAENGQTIDLSLFNVELINGKMYEAEKIEWSSSDIDITDGKYVKPTESGVYKLTAKSADAKKTVYLVSKAETDSEYVLYYEDFSDATLSQFTTVEATNGSASIANGKITLNASASTSAYVRILLPEFLGDFGDYRIVANATILTQVNNKRWTSVMFRVQKNDYPYYQLAIRQNATLNNGVELAERTAADGWNVRHKGPFTEAITSSKNYTLVADVHGSYASATINGKLVLEGENFGEFRTGRIGLQANGCTAVYDSIKVVLSDHTSYLLPPDIADINEVDTGIINSATVVTEVNDITTLNSLSTSKISAAIMRLGADLNITDKNGNVIAEITDVFKKLDGKVIPIFSTSDKDTVLNLSRFLKSLSATDVMLISDDAEILKYAHDIYPGLKGIYDLRAMTPDSTNLNRQLEEIREKTNTANSRICLLNSSFADKTVVEYLNRRATTVWVSCESDKTVDYLTCITSGAYGILASDADMLINAMSSKYFAVNSIIRAVQVIGHRGMPSKGPENTIEGSKTAIHYGATIVENDVYLSKDGVVVVMHDSTIDRTTNGTGNVESMTYEQLSKYYVDTFSGIQAKIPTLEDYFKEFKGQDVVIYIEIKTSNANVVPAIKKLIEKYDFMDQSAVIAFSEEQAALVREQIPGLSCGYLTSAITDANSVMTKVGELDTTFNPKYTAITPQLVRALTLRGITVWPWTVNKTADFDKYYLAGTSGITTNYADFVSKYLKSIDADKSEYVFGAGQFADVTITSTNYMRENTAVSSAEMVFISGNDTVKYENGKLTATTAGTAYVMFRVSYKLNNGTTVYVSTQPVTVTVK